MFYFVDKGTYYMYGRVCVVLFDRHVKQNAVHHVS